MLYCVSAFLFRWFVRGIIQKILNGFPQIFGWMMGLCPVTSGMDQDKEAYPGAFFQQWLPSEEF